MHCSNWKMVCVGSNATMTTTGKNLHLYLDASLNNVGPEHDYHLGTLFSSIFYVIACQARSSAMFVLRPLVYKMLPGAATIESPDREKNDSGGSISRDL